MKRCAVGVALAAWFVVSCGVSSDEKKSDLGPTLNLASKKFVSIGEGLQESPAGITGTGTMVALAPLKAVKSASHYDIKGELREGGHLAFFSHSTKDGSGGVGIRFSNVAGVLKVALEGNGKVTDISSYFEGNSATELSYAIEVHNNESPAHIIVFGEHGEHEHGEHEHGEHEHGEHEHGEHGESEILFDSGDVAYGHGNGKGAYWSLSLENAVLADAVQEESHGHGSHGHD